MISHCSKHKNRFMNVSINCGYITQPPIYLPTKQWSLKIDLDKTVSGGIDTYSLLLS